MYENLPTTLTIFNNIKNVSDTGEKVNKSNNDILNFKNININKVSNNDQGINLTLNNNDRDQINRNIK
mgnify:CR=1 FL=1